VSNLKERRQQIQALSYNEAQKELKELLLKLFNLRLQKQRGEVKNSRLFAQTRKDIARVRHRITMLERES
jgi:ribosomal protein L29